MDILFTLLRGVIIAMPFVVAILVALGGVWTVVAASQRPLWGAWVLAIGFLVETWFIIAPQVPLGIRVSSTDLVALLLLGGLAGRLFMLGMPIQRGLFLAWLAFGALMLASGAAGLIKFGTPAGVELRENFYFWVAGLYFASFRYTADDLHRLRRVMVVAAWGVLAVAIYRWVGLEAGFVSRATFLVAGASSEFRAVGSQPALVVAMAGMLYFARWLEGLRGRDGLLAAVLLGFVVVFQHRSVWLATIAMLLALLWLRRERLPQVLPWLVAGNLVFGGLIAGALALGYLDPLAGALEKSVTSVAEKSGTHTARIGGWVELLSDWVHYPIHQVFLGKPYGSGFARYVEGQLNTFSPHNFYVELLLRVGLVGLLIWLGVLFSLVWSAGKGRLALLDRAGIDLALAVMLGWMVFYVAYQGSYVHGAGYGVALALAMAWRRAARAAAGQRAGLPAGMAVQR